MPDDCEHTWRTISVDQVGSAPVPSRAHQECTECGRFRTTKDVEWVDEDEDE